MSESGTLTQTPEDRWQLRFERVLAHPLDTLEERGKAARDGAGWHACLDALSAALDGAAHPRAALDGYRDVRARYVESFGPEAATIGPPDGMQ